MDTKAVLTQFIADDLLMGQSRAAITPDTSLIESGILDSLSLIRLINFVEERFNLIINDEEIIPDNFETINLLASLISSRQQ